jgi:hypothetical protein
MFGDHFYHAILRKSVAVFGTLFNDLKVVRKDNNGIVKDVSKVPLSYGPKQKFLARIDQQANLDDPKIALKLPRMSFEITNLSYDTATKTSPLNTITTSSSPTTRSTIGQITPYIVDMQLNIMAKNQDDALQIFEQIIPYFQPTYNLSVKFVEGLDKSFDVPITLTAINVQDDYEGEFSSRRALIYTLDFSMKVKFFGPTAQQSVVTTVATDINNFETFGFIEEIIAESTTSIVQAQYNAVLVGDIITRYEFRDKGRGYANPPTVTVDQPTSVARTAVISASLENGLITAFNITDPGLYYAGSETITINGLYDNNGTIEEFTDTLTYSTLYGKISEIDIPARTDIVTINNVTAEAPTGTPADFTAKATAVLVDGRVDELIPTDFGAGYSSVPTVSITAPVSTDATTSVFEGVDTTDDNQIS